MLHADFDNHTPVGFALLRGSLSDEKTNAEGKLDRLEIVDGQGGHPLSGQRKGIRFLSLAVNGFFWSGYPAVI